MKYESKKVKFIVFVRMMLLETMVLLGTLLKLLPAKQKINIDTLPISAFITVKKRQIQKFKGLQKACNMDRC